MKQNWDRAIASVFTWEGGDAVRENEPGGAVSRGVSLAVWREEHPGATAQDLFDASDADIKSIYERRYARPIFFDDMPAGLDIVMLHAAVMQGPTGAKKLLALCDPVGRPAMEVAAEVLLRQAHKKMHDKNVVRFGPGWSDRFVAVFEIAKELAGGSHVVQPDVATKSTP